MVFSSGINNSGGMPQIGGSAGEFVRPGAGRPYQMWLNGLDGYLWYDNGQSWNILKANPITPYNYGTGLTNADYNISVNLSTGVASGNQAVIGGNSGDIINPAYLTLIANIGDGPNSFLNFYSIAPGTRYYQDSGNWNFGGLTDTGFLANFEGDVNFVSDIYCNNVFANNGSIADFSTFKISGTGGSGVLQMVRNSVTPSQVLNNTVFFADISGRLSWFNSNTSWKRTIEAGLNGVLTANRMWTLPDEDTMLAGLSVANVFTAAQTLPAGSAGATSINFGTANTGFYADASNIYFSILGIQRLNILNSGLIIQPTNGYSISGRLTVTSDGSGNMTLQNSGQTDFSSLKFGGNSSSFPALKKSGTKLQARLADDSAFANIQGKLQTDTNYTAGVQVPTGYITIYDAAGTAYKVSCNV